MANLIFGMKTKKLGGNNMTRARDVANRTIVANSVGATELDLTDNYAFTGTISGAGSNIIEKIDMVCNGEAHVVNGTTYTPSNVTAAVALTDTHTVITGSSISYIPRHLTRLELLMSFFSQ